MRLHIDRFKAFRFSRFVQQAAATVLLGTAAHASAQGAGYWHTRGNQILDANGQQVRIAGINWYGFETTRAVAGGLTSQDYKTILQTIKTQGYNTVRIPLSNQMVEAPSYPSISYNNSGGSINADLQGLNSLQILDKIVTAAGNLGLKIILDNHRSEAGDSAEANGLWYTNSYPEANWIKDWTTLAQRYAGNSTVIGFDLRNEPHNAYSGGACWDCGGANDWHLAAQRAGNAVLAQNPNLLIFVEGVDAYNQDYYWWGGNLQGVANSPVTLSVSNQLVYSAHDYGPTEYGQQWFNGSTTAASLGTVWTNHWGFIAKNGIAPVWLGEFGTTNNTADIQSSTPGSEGQWFSSLVGYLSADKSLGWTYWALNGEDRYGLLDSNYSSTPVSSQKQSLLATIQFPLAGGTAAAAPAAPANLAAKATSSSQVALTWSPSSTAGATYSISFGTTSGATNTVLTSGVSGTSYNATGLNPSTTYYFTVRAVSSGSSSAASNQATATTQAGTVPAAPSGLQASSASSSQINLRWTASTTSGVTYNVYSGTASGAATTLLSSGVNGTAFNATGLKPATTYYFVVKASSAAGLSAASNQASAGTAAASGGGSCRVTYTNQNDWGSGFTGGISITNTGTTALNSWTVSWSYAGNQLLNQSWNGNYTQSGKTVTISNASWNAAIPAGGTVSGIGFNATYSGANPSPTTFTLNGTVCQ